jgi:hypothetical protein
MRFSLALFLLMTLCASANAASRPHHARWRHAFVQPSPAFMPGYVSPNGVRIYRDDTAPGGYRTSGDPPVSYNDPSKYGGSP